VRKAGIKADALCIRFFFALNLEVFVPTGQNERNDRQVLLCGSISQYAQEEMHSPFIYCRLFIRGIG